MMKRIFLVITVFLVFPLTAGATNVTFESGAQVTTTAGTYDVSGNLAIDQLIAETESFTLSVPANSNGAVDIISPDRHTFTYSSVPGWNVAFTCGSSESQLKFTNLTPANSVTVTPSATVCTTSTSVIAASGGGGGGGGGGGSTPPPAPAPAPAPTPATTTPPATLTPTSSPLAPFALAPPVPPAPAPASIVAAFARDIKFGDVSEDARKLQRFLNANGFTVAASGPGSPGNETSRFGPLTERAVKNFQAANGISQTGYVGPLTRAAMNAAGVPAPAPAQAPASAPSGGAFLVDLQFGHVNDDVLRLQQFLNANGFSVAASGPGSAGSETNRFGPATKRAVMAYQAANGISQTGYVGPLTRGAMNSAVPASAPGTLPTPAPAPSATEAEQINLLQQQIQALLQQIQGLQGQQ